MVRKGETDYKGKFWVGQRVRILNLPDSSNVLCNTGIIRKIDTRFERTPDLQVNTYYVRIDGVGGLFKDKIISRIYNYGSSGSNLEPIIEE